MIWQNCSASRMSPLPGTRRNKISSRAATPPPWAVTADLVRQFPGVAALWTELGMAAAGELDFAPARQAFQRAAELAAADPTLLVTIGQQYHRLRRLDEAAGCFRQAVRRTLRRSMPA